MELSHSVAYLLISMQHCFLIQTIKESSTHLLLLLIGVISMPGNLERSGTRHTWQDRAQFLTYYWIESRIW